LISAGRRVEQERHFGYVVLTHPAFHFDVCHSGEATDPHYPPN
jgi:hypothetical protein